MTDVNEDTQAVYDARIAAGDPADIDTQAGCSKDNYQMYANLLDIPDFNWAIFHEDARTAFEQISGIPDYVPMVNPFAGYFWTFIFDKTRMAEAGLDPKTSVTTIDELNAFLAELKTFVDADPKLEYVLDTGWHPWAWGTVIPSCMAIGTGHGKEEQRQLFLGETRWDDKDNNPFVPFFVLMKDYYEQGYLPKKWWTRNWDEYENGMIAGQSIMTFHGPWMWDKLQAGIPGIQLDGFHWPAGKEDELFVTATAAFDYNTNAAAIYTVNNDKANAEEALKAFLWWHTPEALKMQCEAIGWIPACDLSSVGGADVRHTQYVECVKSVLDGKAGSLHFDDTLLGPNAVAQYMKGGAEGVMESDTMASLYGDYLEGTTSLDDLLGTLQKRWEVAYPIS